GEKFDPVIAERDDDGGACVPAYIQSRIYVDVSSPQVYYDGYEQLLRLIYGAPAFAKPPVGPRPSYLDSHATTGSVTTHQLRRAIDALETSKLAADSFVRDYLRDLARAIVSLRALPK